MKSVALRRYDVRVAVVRARRRLHPVVLRHGIRRGGRPDVRVERQRQARGAEAAGEVVGVRSPVPGPVPPRLVAEPVGPPLWHRPRRWGWGVRKGGGWGSARLTGSSWYVPTEMPSER